MIQRTWPYGTTKRAKVLEHRHGRHSGKLVEILVVAELECNEAHILVGTRSDGEAGDVGTMTFIEGGSMGGYWHFIPDALTPKE